VLTVITLTPFGCAKAGPEDISTATRTAANNAADTIAAVLKVFADALMCFSLLVEGWGVPICIR
jgi:hypothetical protein